MNWNLLRSLIAVDKYGSVRKAARSLGISQPALSSQLRQLEKQLGEELFQRSHRELKLNHLGHKAADAGRKMGDIFDLLSAEIRATVMGETNQLHLAVERDLARSYFVRIISKIIERQDPKPTRIRIQSEFEASMADELRSGKFDFAFSGNGPDVIGLEPILTVNLPVVCVGVKKWSRVLGRPSQSEADFFKTAAAKNIPVIYPSRTVALHGHIRNFLARHGLSRADASEIELWPMTAVAEGISEGLGIGFLPLNYVGDALAEGEIQLLYNWAWDWGLKLHCYQSPILRQSPVRQAILETFAAEQKGLLKIAGARV